MKEHKRPSKKKTLSPPEPARVIGFDNHPDSFTAAILTGSDAASAVVETVYDRIAQGRLEDWLCKHTKQEDTIVMEASDNSFAACEVIRAQGRKAVVLESEQCAKMGKRYCANDRSDAVKLARLYLSGLAGKVWVPDATTRMRREVFYAYQQAVCDNTRARQRIRSFLNQHRIRLGAGFRLTGEASLAQLLALRVWEPTQQLLLSQYHQALRNAHLRRTQLREVKAAELLKEPAILRLIRFCGLRHIAAFALAAFIGDIRRFAGPKQLVAYIGLNPGVSESGNSKGSTHLRKNGCAPLRSLLVQAAQTILRVPKAPFAQWGRKLVIRRGRNRATIGVARKLATAVWYCLSGAFTALEEGEPMVASKLSLLVIACGSLKSEYLVAIPAGIHDTNASGAPKKPPARVLECLVKHLGNHGSPKTLPLGGTSWEANLFQKIHRQTHVCVMWTRKTRSGCWRTLDIGKSDEENGQSSGFWI